MNNLILYIILNLVLVLILSPLFMSVIKKVKAWAQGRKGPSVLQGYYNLAKLLRKEQVFSVNSSWISRFTPYINLAAILMAALFVPLVLIPAKTGLAGNIILFLYLLALAKFFMALAGLDAGSTFGGMGSSREMSISAVIEPITIIVFATLGFVIGTINLHEVFQITSTTSLLSNPTLILVAISVFIVMIVETARIPVDNPETHLELTMVHEAMLLETSGKGLALMELSHAIKQTLFMAIIINIIFPVGLSSVVTVQAIGFSALMFALKGIVLAVIIGVFESSMAKQRLFRLPSLFAVAFFLSIITLLLGVFR